VIQGPNVKRLICHKMSLQMVPPGGGAGAAIASLMKPGNIGVQAREATKWVEAAISLVRAAAEPNPYKTMTDEDIAGEILKGIEAKKKRDYP
jgi:hypothetical protein